MKTQNGNIHNLYSSLNQFLEVCSTNARGGKPTNNFRKKNETTQLHVDNRLLKGS